MEIKTRVKEMRQQESEKEHPVHTEEKGGKAPQSVWALEDKPRPLFPLGFEHLS
jgi:hypothetical protein